MNADLVVAVDCSTTAAKAVVLDANDMVVAQASRSLAMTQPRPAWHEQQAQDWWTATRDAIKEAAQDLDDPGAVAALRQRESFVCVRADVLLLRPAILWVDGRAHQQFADFGSAEVHRLSVKPPRHHSGHLQSRLSWAAPASPACRRVMNRRRSGLSLAATDRSIGHKPRLRRHSRAVRPAGQDMVAGDLAISRVRADQPPELATAGAEELLNLPY